MISLCQQGEEAATPSPLPPQPAAEAVQQLQAEIKHLQRVVALKDEALEEIGRLVERNFSSKEGIHSFEIVEKATSSRDSAGLRRPLPYEISAEIDENIRDSFSAMQQEFHRIFHYHSTALEILNSLRPQPTKSSPAAGRTPRLLEVPVEIFLLAETASQAVQVDLFESPKNSESEEIEKANRILRAGFIPTIREVAVEMEAYVIPVEVYVEREEGVAAEKLPAGKQSGQEDEISLLKAGLQQLNFENRLLKEQFNAHTLAHKQSQVLEAEIKSMQKELQGLDTENLSLKDQLTRIQEEPFSFEIQITAPYVSFPLDQNKSVEVPIEFELENQAGSSLKMEMVMEEDAASAVKTYNEETRPNIISEASLPNHRTELQTRSEISEENASKSGSIILSEHSQPQLKAEAVQSNIHIVEVPVEVIKYIEVVKYIEVLIASVEEVEVYSIMPVEVEVETERIVEVPVLHEIPVELFIIQDQPEGKQLAKLHSALPEPAGSDEPIELQIELEMEESMMERIVERVVEVEKIVYVDRPVELIKTVYVDRIVEVPVEVLVEKVIQYETVIERTNEVIIEKSKEVIIDRNVIREIPVELHLSQKQAPYLQQEEGEPVLLQAAQDHGQIHSQHSQIQITGIVLEAGNERAQRIVEVPVEVFIERVVEVIKIVEVPVVQIVEVAVELKTSDVVEVPVEMEMEPLIYEVPVSVVNALEVVEIPLEMQEPPIVIEVPVEMNLLEEEAASPSKKSPTRHPANEQYDSPTVRLSLNQPEHTQALNALNQEVYVIPLNQAVTEIEIQTNPNNQIVVEIPYEFESREHCNAETQTAQAKEKQQAKEQQQAKEEERVSLREDQQLLETLNLLESAARPAEQRRVPIQIIEVPVEVEVEVESSEEVRKALEHKYRDRISDLHSQYSAEIASLHEMLQSLQRIIVEGQQEMEHLKDELESKALQEESLNSALHHLQDKLALKEEEVSEKEAQIRLNGEETTAIQAKYQQQTGLYQELKQEFVLIAGRLNELQNQPPIVYEMAVEMVIKTDRQSVWAQTDDLLLAQEISVIEMPVEIEVVEKVSESSLRKSEDEEARSSSTNQKYFRGYSEEELFEKLKAMGEALAVKAELVERFTQTERQEVDDLVDFERAENQLNITEMFDNTQFIKDRNYKLYNEMEVSLREDHLISGIESVEEYDNIIDLKIYEYAVEVFPEPVIYEVPVDLKLFKELAISEVQTEAAYSHLLQKEIREIPVELALKKQTVEACIQTEMQTYTERSSESYKNNQIVTMEGDVQASRNCLLYSSNTFESRLIQIPVELNIEVEKQIISIDIQTKETWNEVVRQGKEELKARSQQSKLKITPAFQEIHVASSYLPAIANGNPYQTNNVMRLQSACFSIPENRILALASNNQSLTYEQFYQGLGDTQKLLESNNNIRTLMESADIQEIINNEVIAEENEAYHSRVAVHIEENNEMNFHEVGELNEAAGKGSEIKQNYSELYEHANNQADRHRVLSQRIELENAELKQEMEDLQNRYDEKIKRLQTQNAFLERTINEHERIMEEQKLRLTEFSFMKAREQKKLEKLEEEYEKVKGYNANLQFSSNKEIERLQTILNDKIQEIKDLKLEEHQAKELYEAQIMVLRSKLIAKDEMIDELQEENQKKLAKIEQLMEYQDQLRKAVVYAKQNHENSAAALYEQQFERIKDDFQDKKRQLKEEISACHQEIDALREDLQTESRRNRNLNEEVLELEGKLAQAQEEYMILLNVKGELESDYVDNLKELNMQLQECRELIGQKDTIIQELQTSSEKITVSPDKLRQANPEASEGAHPTIRMQFLSRKASREAEDPRLLSIYIQKLEKLLLRYEKIMGGNEATIEELQEKVCEYLRDALEKEQEAEMLYSKLVEYECAMNNILVEKITLEIENKRMAKAVELSERKVLILGNKLIDAVGKRQLHECEDSDYYYQ